MNKLFFTIGVLCLLVPAVLQIQDGKQQETLISTYQKEIEEYGAESQSQCMEAAIAYNEMLMGSQGTLGEPEINSYEEQLNLTGTGMMGNLEIPKIDLQLPLYHGTSDDVLAAGIGHLEGTSLPVGGKNCHPVLTGHCGLPNAELFTRLDEMEEGDYFFIRVCGKLLGYEVKKIQVVEPDDETAVLPEEQKDLVSLVTCTPYGLNTHRLIVTGERMGEETNVERLLLEETERGIDEKIYCIIGVGFILLICLVCRSRGRKPGADRSSKTGNGYNLHESGRMEGREDCSDGTI